MRPMFQPCVRMLAVALAFTLATRTVLSQETVPSQETREDSYYIAPPTEYLTGAEALEDAPADGPLKQSAAGDIDALRKQLKELEAKEKKRSDAEKKKADDEKKKKDEEAAKALDWMDMSDDKWTVKLGGHIQLDHINWAHNSPVIPGQDYTQFRRIRLWADGTGYGKSDFRLQMTLEPEADGNVLLPAVKDAYYSMNEIPLLGRFRIGNFFVPFSLEQVTNDTNNIFLERSIPTQGIFAADREVGMAFYNCTPNQRVTWASGLFVDSINEGTKLRIDDNQGYRVSGRITGLPYYDEPSNGRYLMHVGAGVLHTKDQDGIIRFRARPQIKEGPRLIDTGDLLGPSYTSGNVEFACVNGPVTIQSEAFISNVNLTGAPNQNAYGAYLHGSWFLTGENRVFERFGQHGAQFARNVPYSNFFLVPGMISLGGIELKARWSYLDLARFNAGQYNDLTVGFNWYWSERTRVMFDWIHPMTSNDTVFGAQSADILGIRFDNNW